MVQRGLLFVVGFVVSTKGLDFGQWQKEVKAEWHELRKNERAEWVAVAHDEAPLKEWTVSLRNDLKTQLVIGTIGCVAIGRENLSSMCWLTALSIGLLDACLSFVLSNHSDFRETRNWRRIVSGDQDGYASIALLALGSASFEELLFRTPVIWTGSNFVLMMSALIFGCVHAYDAASEQRDHDAKLRRFVSTAKSSLLYGLVAQRTHALAPAVLSHAVHNFFLLSLV